jgi:fluoroquinolone transport system permease protein
MPLRELIRPTLRTIRWGGLAGATPPAAFIVWHFHNQPDPTASSSALGLRMAAVMLALGLAFVLDDPTEDTTGSTPVSVLARRALRVGLTLPPMFAFWLLLRGYAGSGLPAWPLFLEVLAFGAIGLAGAALGSRVLSDRLGGPAGAGSVALVALVAGLLPWAGGLLTRTPGTSPHAAAGRWWLAMIAVSVLVWWRSSSVPAVSLWRLPFRTPRRRFLA